MSEQLAASEPPAELDELVRQVDELSALVVSVLGDESCDDLRDARARLVGRVCNVAVVGEFKRGKSSLVNALLGQALVPTGVLPVTSSITLIRYGPRPRALIHFSSGGAVEYGLSQLRRFVTEAGNPRNELGVEQTIVELPSELLRGGLQLVDTPGIGSIHEHNTDAARRFLQRLDAAILVLAADQPVTAGERGFLAELRGGQPPLIVFNKTDLLEGGESLEALEFVRTSVGGAEVAGPLFPVSTKTGEGVEELRAALAELKDHRNGAVIRRSTGRLVASVAAAAAETAALEARALRLPIDTLEARISTFHRWLEELSSAAQAADAVLVDQAAEILRDTVDTPLVSLAARVGPRLIDELNAVATEKEGGASLGPTLDRWIEGRIRRLIDDELAPAVEADTASQIERQVERHGARVGDLLLRLGDATSQIFGAGVEFPLPDIRVEFPRSVQYKMHDEEEALGRVLTGARRRVPGRFGRRLVLRDSRRRLLELLDRHAGRLRVAVREQSLASLAQYRLELRTAVAAAVDRCAAAVERAHTKRTDSEAAVMERLIELEFIHSRCLSLAARVVD